MDIPSFICGNSYGRFKSHLFEPAPSSHHSFPLRLLDRVSTAMCNALAMHVLAVETESTSLIPGLLPYAWISNGNAFLCSEGWRQSFHVNLLI
ncbi:unnamed protein product [Spirodela intermedia]|uniref:Uncharacterized protein n=1 Tax=Spirodela intermedia TaxID=51605 RepID=A0A7I8KSD6_SPIIN|nr:unnamed protein product [Spirodela intermedia]